MAEPASFFIPLKSAAASDEKEQSDLDRPKVMSFPGARRMTKEGDKTLVFVKKAPSPKSRPDEFLDMKLVAESGSEGDVVLEYRSTNSKRVLEVRSDKVEVDSLAPLPKKPRKNTAFFLRIGPPAPPSPSWSLTKREMVARRPQLMTFPGARRLGCDDRKIILLIRKKPESGFPKLFLDLTLSENDFESEDLGEDDAEALAEYRTDDGNLRVQIRKENSRAGIKSLLIPEMDPNDPFFFDWAAYMTQLKADRKAMAESMGIETAKSPLFN